MKLKLLIFLWVFGGSLFAQEQDSTCFKVEKTITNFYVYFFRFDVDYEQYFKPEKIRNQQIKELQYAVLNSKNIHCSTVRFGFDSKGQVDYILFIDPKMPDDRFRKLIIIRDSLNRVSKKIKAPIDEESMIDTIGQYFIKNYSYSSNGNLIKTFEDKRNGDLYQRIEEFQYDAQNRIERMDFQWNYPSRDTREHFIYSYKKKKTKIKRFHYFYSNGELFAIKKLNTRVRKFDQNGRLLFEKFKHPKDRNSNTLSKFYYNELGLLLLNKHKRAKRHTYSGDRFYEPFIGEYKNGLLNSFKTGNGNFLIKRIE